METLHKAYNLQATPPHPANKKIGKEVNAENYAYAHVSHRQNVRQNDNINTVTKSCENVAKFRYFENILTNQTRIHEDIKRGLNSAIVCCHRLIFCICVCSKKVQIKKTRNYDTAFMWVQNVAPRTKGKTD
jgi:hypothetical protein